MGSSNVEVDDVPVQAVWAHLKSDASSILIDVRTSAEWAFVGLPDLAEMGKRVLTVEWQTFPDSRVDLGFQGRVCDLLEAASVKKDAHIFFICRSGGRSRMAAEAMAEKGYTHLHNVADGFEGPLDANRHRGRVAGWKAVGLPWVQG